MILRGFVLLLALLGTVMVVPANGQEDSQPRTVIGPSNIDLADGATALRTGNAEDGVRLTRSGLRSAANDRERVAGYSNLCVINDRHWRSYSNRALVYLKQKRYADAERDIEDGEAINPNSRTLKIVKAMLLDETDPVAPSITIDDRRQVPVEGGE
jgi:hypothetical protein